MKQKRTIFIAVAMTIVPFIIDIQAPLGYADWLLYFIPLFLAASVLRRVHIPILPAVATLLIVADFFLSPSGGNAARAAVNRAMGILVLWWISFIIMKRKQAEEGLQRSYHDLERRVKDRTGELSRANEALHREIAGRKRAEEEIKRLSRQYELILKFADVGILGIDLRGTITFVNEAAAAMLGYEKQALVGKNAHATLHYARPDGTAYPPEQCPIYAAERERTIRSGEEVFWKKDGTGFPIEFQSIPIHEDGIGGAVLTFRDITERKRMEEDIRHMAHHDVLTGLPNRRLFINLIKVEAAQARRHRAKLAVMFLDLDRFKEVNDTLGHEVGDLLLKEVAGRLRSTMRESDTIARIGGDEFNIILADVDNPEYAARAAQKILKEIQRPFAIRGHELNVSTSLGISIFPDDSGDLDTLLRYADIAMYHAKERGRNRFQFYSPDINIRTIARVRFESRLRQSLARGELAVHYQPRVVVSTRKLVAAEALVRWRHPDLGLLDSKQFVPTAESIGFIIDIDEWVLRTACAQVKAWNQGGHPGLCAAVNLSSRIFQNRDFLETVSRILDETGLPPDRLEIDITERVAMTDIERTAVVLGELTRKGITISIDHFGTGYSSLDSLKRLPIQKLKIARSFMKDIATDPDDRVIIRAVTAMAHTMNMSVVAQGVETEEQMSFLLDADCDEAQGYLLNKALPPEEFSALIAAA